VSDAVTIFDFLVETASRRYALQGRSRNTEDTVAAAQFILPTIAKVPNAMLRSEYVRMLAERLHLDEEAVAQELSCVRARGSAPLVPRAAGRRMTPPAQGPERLLTALVVDEPSRWLQVKDRLSMEDLTDPASRRILEIIAELVEARRPATPAQVVSRLSAEGQGSAVAELVTLAQSIASKDEALNDCLRRLRRRGNVRRLTSLRVQIQAAQDTGQEDEMHALLTAYQQQVKGGE
jgi:DNA primase